MCEQVAGHAAAGSFHIKPPQTRAALRQLRADRPVLKKLCAIVKDSTKLAFVNQLLCESDSGNTTIIIPNDVRHFCFLNCRDHLATFWPVHRKRLLAENHLARFGGGDGDLGVAVVRCADVNRVNVLARDELAPVGLNGFIAPLRREGFDLGFITRADGLEYALMFEVEEVVDLAIGVRVSATHEAVADESDAKLFVGHD